LPQQSGQYDGFNYLGFGVILLCGLVTLLYLLRLMKTEHRLDQAKNFFNSYLWLLLICIFLTLFAVSNNIYWGNTELFSVELPDVLVYLCGIFRASSRIFYPVYYVIFIYSLVGLYRLTCKLEIKRRENSTGIINLSMVFICCFLILQLYDLSDVIAQKHAQMDERMNITYDGPQELLNLDGYDFMLVDEVWGQRYNLFLTGRNKIRTNACDANTGWYVEAWHLLEAEEELMAQGELKDNYVYVTYDSEKYRQWMEEYGDRASFYTWTNTYGQQGIKRYWPGDIYYMLPDH
jgi:hypothetical membrane protein